MSLVLQAGTRPLRTFIDVTLRGVGQVFLQNHPLTGAFFLLAILANSLLSGDALASQGVSAFWLFFGAVLGTVISTSTAMLLRLDRQAIQEGLYGYNGTLVGIAIPFFFQAEAGLILLIAVATALSTVVTELCSRLLRRWQLPALTAPFVLTTWLALATVPQIGGLQPSGFMPGASPALPLSAPLTLLGAGEGLFTGVGQVMLQGHWLAGLLMLIGLLVNSRRSFAFGLLGSFLGLLLGVMGGADSASLQAGLHGFNPVLTGIALGAVFTARHATVTALLGMGATFAMTGILMASLTPTGMPALTAPFIVTTWLFLAARTIATRLRTQP
ncbi:Urea transporter [compost metagenome]